MTGLRQDLPDVPAYLLSGRALVRRSSARCPAVIAAWTPRRAYATAAIIAVFIVPPIIVALIAELAVGDAARLLVLASPGDILDGVNAALFGDGVAEARPSSRPTCPVGRTSSRPSSRRRLHGAGRAPLPADQRVTRSGRRLRRPGGPGRRHARPPFPAIELEHVSRWYGNVVAVNDISFALGPGVTGLLGPNGAGKSTLLHLLVGLAGAVGRGGHGSAAGPPSATRPCTARSGLVPEREAVPGYLTGHEFVRLNAELQGDAGRRRRHRPGDRHGRADRGGRSPASVPTRRACASGPSSQPRSSTSRGSCCSTSRSTGWIPASGCT